MAKLWRRCLPFMLVSVALACGNEGGSGSDSASGGSPGSSGGSSNSGGSDNASGGEGGKPSSTGGDAGSGGAAATGGSVTGGSPGEAGAAGSGGTRGPELPLDGFGTLTGDPDNLHLDSSPPAAPEFHEVSIDFGTETFSSEVLSSGGKQLYTTPNAGGSSLASETMAFELLHRLEGATFRKTETEVIYPQEGKKADFLVQIDGENVGVGVVRAFKFPLGTPLDISDATSLLEKKLGELTLATANAAGGVDAWSTAVLVILARDAQAASAVAEAYAGLDAATKGNIVLYVCVTDGDDAFVYMDT